MNSKELKECFLPLGRKLYAVALRLCGNPQDAEDMVQDLYLKLWEKRNRLPKKFKVEAYCVAMMKNLYYDKIRSNKHDMTDNMPIKDIAADEILLSDELEVKDSASMMRLCIDRLPEKQRMVVLMRDVDGLSFPDIEAATGMGRTNIRVTLSRARNTLRKQFNIIKNYGNKENKSSSAFIL